MKFTLPAVVNLVLAIAIVICAAVAGASVRHVIDANGNAVETFR